MGKDVALTAEQERVLAFLRGPAQGRWVPLLELAQLRLLVEDDDLFIPSLVARGLLEHSFEAKAVRARP